APSRKALGPLAGARPPGLRPHHARRAGGDHQVQLPALQEAAGGPGARGRYQEALPGLRPAPAGARRPPPPARPPPPHPPPAGPAAAQHSRTMLAEPEAPIQYNCPNCKKPLEAPASEGGTKKPCPACGQRLQVPAAPPPAAAQPNLNRTMLATDQSRGQPVPQRGHPAAYPLPPPP